MGRRPLRVHIGLILCLAIQLVAAGVAGAVTINPSYESGDLTGWSSAGAASATGTWRTIAPTDGSFQLLLTTRVDEGAVTTASTESTLGLAVGTIQSIFDTHLGGISTGSGPVEGSAVQQSFVATAGDHLVFDWNFITRETPPDTLATDFLWQFLTMPDGTNTSSVLGHAAQPASDFANAQSQTFQQTGTTTFSFTLQQTGTYTLTLGVHDVQETNRDSFGIFDNFLITKSPEPDTALLVGLGLLGLAWQGRRRR